MRMAVNLGCLGNSIIRVPITPECKSVSTNGVDDKLGNGEWSNALMSSCNLMFSTEEYLQISLHIFKTFLRILLKTEPLIFIKPPTQYTIPATFRLHCLCHYNYVNFESFITQILILIKKNYQRSKKHWCLFSLFYDDVMKSYLPWHQHNIILPLWKSSLIQNDEKIFWCLMLNAYGDTCWKIIYH